jgi:TolA-binding protein
MEPHLKALGERVAAAQDQRLHTYLDLGRARARLLDSMQPSRRLPVRVLLVAALLLLLVGGTAAFTLRERPLAFRLGDGDGSDGTSQWIAAPEGAAVPIHFSDGTQLTLLENARARVVDLDSHGATVVVERGELRASVVPRKDARWRVFVGPFAVRVTGTEFDVGWQPESERFSLSLRAGSVLVTGPGLDGERAVHAGETLRLSPRCASPAPKTEPELAAKEPEPADTPAATPLEGSAGAPSAPKSSRARELHTRPSQRDFRELASHQQYQEALAAAETAGFERLCRTAELDDLLLLADTARLAGTADEARRAYRSVRERFPGRDAGKAAFFLGRSAFDRDADYAQAARYFALSIQEQPEGPLAREAAGRLLETQVLLADSTGARNAARQYLDRYPDGPHAKVAKRVLAQP